MGELGFSAGLRRSIRQDAWDRIGTATVHLVRQRFADGQVEAAGELLHYAEHEYRTLRELYGRWNREMVNYLAARVLGATVESVFRSSLLPWVHLLLGVQGPLTLEMTGPEARLRRSDGKLALGLVPAEGHRYLLQIDEARPIDDVAAARLARTGDAMRRGDAATAGTLLDEHIASSRLAHDIFADWAWGLLSHGYRELGEDRLEEMQRETVARWVTDRYRLIGQMSTAEQAQLTIEGMRGHFCGPGREGDVEVMEEVDRWVIGFDPCGSGARMRRGDELNGTPSRYEPPFNFVNVRGAHPWTWGRPGVCLYCSHCAIVNEILPIETVGYPMRVTEYPADATEKCRWIIYKRPELVPEEAYRRVGKEKPAHPKG